MRIKGLRKFSLLDYPEKICSIVFTPGCNFRCPFCHNPSLVLETSDTPVIKEDDFFVFLTSRVGRLDGVCVTGGEPLLHNDLPDFLRRIRRLGFLVKLDTNGSFPDRLESLLNENLVDYVAMDIKNAPAKYPETVGLTELSLNKIEQSVKLLLQSEIQYEFRTTVTHEFHTKNDMEAIGRWIEGGKHYAIQNYKKNEHLLNSLAFHSFTSEELEEFRTIVESFVSTVEVRN